MRGYLFNGKHNYNDIGLIMESKSIQPPAKKKIKVDVPGMNGFYDFSTVGSNGEIIYTERSIKVIHGLPARNKVDLYVLYSKALEWLQDVGKCQLIFDDISYFYFMAEVEGISTFQEMVTFGKLEVTFTCEPFKTGLNFVGSTIWDTFNFNEDILQDYSYDVVATEAVNVNIYNPGRLVTPTINCSVPMTVVFAGKIYPLIAGDNVPYGMKLLNGNNTLVINGTGHIAVLFRKVIL